MTTRDARGCCLRHRAGWVPLLALTLSLAGWAQQASADWQRAVREEIHQQRRDSALSLVEQRLSVSPADLEAHAWRGRLLAWKGRWTDAESEYRLVLESAPGDTEILCELSDVLVWQNRTQEALQVLDRARKVAPSQPDVLLRRARVLREMGRTGESRAEFRSVLALDPGSAEAKNGLEGLRGDAPHQLQVGVDIDTFSYTNAAQAQSFTLSSRWTPRWSTTFGGNFCQRFGEDAARLTASAALRFLERNWLRVGGALANDRGIIPHSEASFEYGRGFRLRTRWVHGLETSYQQHWLWYRSAHILTLSANQMFYLPKDWTLSLTVTGARSGFTGSEVEWAPSGATRLGFPLYRRLSGTLAFAVGTENFAQVDQIGRFSARTYAGGLRYRLSNNQDVAGYLASQQRSGGRAQNTFGLSYGIRF